jgi:hypothetical protein
MHDLVGWFNLFDLGVKMVGFLVMLALVYVGKAAWPKLVTSGASPMDWAWPVRLGYNLWMKVFGPSKTDGDDQAGV